MLAKYVCPPLILGGIIAVLIGAALPEGNAARSKLIPRGAGVAVGCTVILGLSFSKGPKREVGKYDF